jgi:hypothetical protein
MGRSFWFECVKCGYRAKVSGGADRGLDVFVQTIFCRDCKELYDAVIRVRMPDEIGSLQSWVGWRRAKSTKPSPVLSVPPSFESVLSRLPFTGVRRFRWLQFKIRCPVSAAHPVQVWNHPDKCPRCRVYLEKNAVPFRIWE